MSCIIEEQDGVRSLKLDSTGYSIDQGAIKLDDLREHVHDFSLLAMYSLCFVNNPLSILVVGLGTGIVPREMIYYRSDTVIDVIEIDPKIVKIAYDQFYYRDNRHSNPHVNTMIGDAMDVISKLSIEHKYDIVFLDAFTSSYIPFHLMCVEFFDMVKNCLSEDAVVAVNLSIEHPSYPRQIKTLQHVFGKEVYLLTGTRNKAAGMIFITDQKPSDIALPSEYYPKLQIPKVKITSEIENAKIFSLSDV